MTTEKKPRAPHSKSKAARIRKLCEQGELTPRQIAKTVGVPPSYVYVLRSRMKAGGGGLPAVSTRSPIPVPGGIQGVAAEHEAVRPIPTVIEQPPLWERVKERIRAWLA